MPRIPTYQQQSTPNAALAIPTADPGTAVARGLANVAQGARQMGGALGYREEVLRRKEEADSMSAAHLAATKARADWATNLVQSMQAEQDQPDGFTDRRVTDFDKFSGELVATGKTASAKQYLSGVMADLRADIVTRSLPWEAERSVQKRSSQYAQSIDHQRITVRTDPTQYDKALEQQAVALNAAGLPQGDRDRLWEVTKEGLAGSAVETLIERSPGAMLKALRQPPGKSGFAAVEGLNADQRDRAINAAEAEVRRREAEARARAAEARQGLAEQEADAFAAKAAGLPATLPSRNAYVAAYGPDGAKRYAQKSQLFGVFDVVSAAVLLPPEEGAAAIAEYRPTQQAGAADQAQIAGAAVAMYEQQRKAFEANPAGMLVGRDPELRAALEGATQPGADPKATQDYVRRVTSAQRAAGIAAPAVLPEDLAAQYAAALAYDPKNPAKRTQALQALQAQWGKAYPQVVRQVLPKAEATAQVLVGMTPETGRQLDAALADGGRETLSKVVPKADAKNFTEALQTQLGPFARTLRDNSDGLGVYERHFEAAQVLGLSMIARGESPRAAAEKAARAVINDQFQYEGTARIPTAYGAKAVMAGAEAAQQAAVGPEKLAIASSQWSDTETAQAELKDTIRRGGYWVTNDDGTGLVLMIAHNRGTSAVMRADGRRYEFTFDELQQLGAKSAGADLWWVH